MMDQLVKTLEEQCPQCDGDCKVLKERDGGDIHKLKSVPNLLIDKDVELVECDKCHGEGTMPSQKGKALLAFIHKYKHLDFSGYPFNIRDNLIHVESQLESMEQLFGAKSGLDKLLAGKTPTQLECDAVGVLKSVLDITVGQFKQCADKVAMEPDKIESKSICSTCGGTGVVLLPFRSDRQGAKSCPDCPGIIVTLNPEASVTLSKLFSEGPLGKQIVVE